MSTETYQARRVHSSAEPASSPAERSVRSAAIAGIVGALIMAIGGFVTQGVELSTSVSTEVWSYPYSGATFIAVSLLWAVSHVLRIVFLLGLKRSGLAGSSRVAGAGLLIAVAGSVLLFAGELAGIPFPDADMDSSAAAAIGALFGFGTLVSAAGLLMAGVTTLRARKWRGWRRFTPLVAGLWAVVLIGLPAPVMSAGIGVFGLCTLALGVALLTQPRHSGSNRGPVS